MVRAKINGVESEFADGVSILTAAREAGNDIPTLCEDARLASVGACRMCLVDVAGRPHETVSCATALTDGMEIETQSPSIEEARKWNLRMLAKSYPAAAFTAN